MHDISVSHSFKPLRDLGLLPVAETDDQFICDCPFCGKIKKLYVSKDSAQWDCKVCGLRGNVYTFLQKWYEYVLEEQDTEDSHWKSLSENRGIKLYDLARSGIVYDDILERWAVPIRNHKGAICNFRLYDPSGRTKGFRGLTTLAHGMMGHDLLLSGDMGLVWICEGEWDCIALRMFLRINKRSGDTVVGFPGANVFARAWLDELKGRDIILCYDKDKAGQEGYARAYQLLSPVAAKIHKLVWPEEAPDGFDLRDFVNLKGTLDELFLLCEPAETVASKAEEKAAAPSKAEKNLPEVTFEETLEVYERWLYMTPGIKDGIKLAFAVVLAMDIPGDPLWLYLVGPPGSAKTVIINSLRQVSNVVHRSNVTAASLVSGFRLEGGQDPSLIPQLDKNIFCLKDFTEILGMNPTARDEIYSLLRGAYDGEVEKQFGNGITRKYYVHFHMVAGVTQVIFKERSASLGERFFMFQILRGVGFDAGNLIRAALENVGEEEEMKEELAEAAAAFLNRKVTRLAGFSSENVERLVGLAQLTSMLRGSVERSFDRERLLTQPFHEVGTRLAKILKKLALGLAALKKEPVIDAEIMDLVSKVALDTCASFSFEIAHALAANTALNTQQIAEVTKIPLATLRDRLKELEMLGCVKSIKVENPLGRGAPMFLWSFTKELRSHWIASGITTGEPIRK